LYDLFFIIGDVKMKDYKNSTVKSSLTAWDYAAAAGFILTMLLLIIGV
jgi:hypothetical protein